MTSTNPTEIHAKQFNFLCTSLSILRLWVRLMGFMFAVWCILIRVFSQKLSNRLSKITKIDWQHSAKTFHLNMCTLPTMSNMFSEKLSPKKVPNRSVESLFLRNWVRKITSFTQLKFCENQSKRKLRTQAKIGQNFLYDSMHHQLSVFRFVMREAQARSLIKPKT